MNKKFAELFSGYGLAINGNYAYGMIKGYETNVVIRMLDRTAPVTIHVSCYTTSEQKRTIEQALQATDIKFFQYALTDYGITLGLNDITAGRLLKRLPDLLNLFYGIFSANGALDAKYCPVCGIELNPETRKKSLVNDFTIYLDQECITNLNKVIIEENKDFAVAPNNYLNGFFGGLLGGVIGGIVAYLFYMAGFVSAISAFVAILCGEFFYKKFAGKQNGMMIVLLSITTLGCMVGTLVLIYAATAYEILVEEYPSVTLYQSFMVGMEDTEFVGYFLSDLRLTLLFSFVGIGYEVVRLSKKIKRRKEIQ